MKKNKWMRLASVLLVLCLITTSVISGTFAKYATTDSAYDEARVAKWGVVVQAAGSLYGPHYDGTNHTPLAYDHQDTPTVTSFDKADVVAPGTLNDKGMIFSVNGQPEVSGKVKIVIQYENVFLKGQHYGVMVPCAAVGEADFLAAQADEKWENRYWEMLDEGDSHCYKVSSTYDPRATYYTLQDHVGLSRDYYPVIYNMTGGQTEFTSGTCEADSMAALVDAIIARFPADNVEDPVIEDGKTTIEAVISFPPNTNLYNILKLDGQNITWKWEFCNKDEDDNPAAFDEVYDPACELCHADTILGNLMKVDGSAAINGEVVYSTDGHTYRVPKAAAGKDMNDYNLETCFGIEIGVTQID